MAATAARYLKRQVLELGGSDPFIVLADADVAAAAAAAVSARNHNAGQSCIAAKRFIVEDAVRGEFTEAFAAGVAKLTVGDPMLENTRVGPLAKASIRQSLVSQVERSVSAGARLVTGESHCKVGVLLPARGARRGEPRDGGQRGRDVRACGRDHFRPRRQQCGRGGQCDGVRPRGEPVDLGSGACGHADSSARCRRGVRQRHRDFRPRMPFGGIKHSGYGRELGAFGPREFTNVKSVWIGPSRDARNLSE